MTTEAQARVLADINARARAEAQARIEDTEWLLSWRRPIDEIAERVGFPSVEAASKFFYRRGMSDIAVLFDTEHKRTRQGAAA